MIVVGMFALAMLATMFSEGAYFIVSSLALITFTVWVVFDERRRKRENRE
jgi:hypothetical protein